MQLKVTPMMVCCPGMGMGMGTGMTCLRILLVNECSGIMRRPKS